MIGLPVSSAPCLKSVRTILKERRCRASIGLTSSSRQLEHYGGCSHLRRVYAFSSNVELALQRLQFPVSVPDLLFERLEPLALARRLGAFPRDPLSVFRSFVSRFIKSLLRRSKWRRLWRSVSESESGHCRRQLPKCSCVLVARSWAPDAINTSKSLVFFCAVSLSSIRVLASLLLVRPLLAASRGAHSVSLLPVIHSVRSSDTARSGLPVRLLLHKCRGPIGDGIQHCVTVAEGKLEPHPRHDAPRVASPRPNLNPRH